MRRKKTTCLSLNLTMGQVDESFSILFYAYVCGV